MEAEKIEQIISRFPESKGNLIAMLHAIQDEFRYLPEEELRYLSRRINVPLTHIYSIANFYNRFSLTPRGEHEISVCLGTACHVKGAGKVLDEMKRTLRVDKGETTPDMKFTLEVVRCLGACSLAPCVVVDGDTHRQVTQDQIADILQSYA